MTIYRSFERFCKEMNLIEKYLKTDLGSGASRYGSSSLLIRTINEAGVAQLARASAFQADCREFESRLPLHFKPYIKS